MKAGELGVILDLHLSLKAAADVLPGTPNM